jgi:transposase
MAEDGMKNDEIAAAINIGESTGRRIKPERVELAATNGD